MNRRIIAALLVALMLALAGCGAETEGTDNSTDAVQLSGERISDVPQEDGIYRIEDAETKSVCWVVVSDGSVEEMTCKQIG